MPPNVNIAISQATANGCDVTVTVGDDIFDLVPGPVLPGTASGPLSVNVSAVSLAILEEAELGAVLATVTPSNPSAICTLSEDAGGLFDLIGGEIVLAGALNFDIAESHALEVTCSLGDETATHQINVIVIVQNDVQPMVSIIPAQIEVPEDLEASTVLATVFSGGEPCVLSNDAGGLFALNASNQIVLVGSLDFETAMQHTVEVTCGALTEQLVVDVTDVVEAGLVVTVTPSMPSVPENVALGTVVATVNTNIAATCTLTGDAGGLFSMNTAGQISVAAALDFETATAHNLTVECADGVNPPAPTAITVLVTDIAELTDITMTPDPVSVPEDAVVGTQFAVITTDVAATSTLSDSAGGLFALDALGNLTVAAPLDFETATSHTIEVTSVDGNGIQVIETFTVGVTDVVEGIVPQVVEFGDLTQAGFGGYQPIHPQTFAVDPVVSYVGLQSGSLGGYTVNPIGSDGRISFAGAAGAPDATVHRVQAQSGIVYDLTILVVPGRIDIASDAEADSYQVAGAVVRQNTVVIRQDAKVGVRNARTSGRGFLSCSSTGQTNAGLAGVTTLRGESGLYTAEGFPERIPGEFHIGGYRAYPISSLDITHLVWQNNPNASAILIEGIRGAKDILVAFNNFDTQFDVDGAGADWSGGFGTTGYVQTRFVYTTNPGIENLRVLNNNMEGGYTQIEAAVSHRYIMSGNNLRAAYFDAEKTARYQPNTAVFEEVNVYGGLINFSVNETPATAPHVDWGQVTGGGAGSLASYFTGNMFMAALPISVQHRFHADRPSSASGGHMWSISGEFHVGTTLHMYTNDWPESVDISYSAAAPRGASSLPIGAGRNTLKLGSSKPGDGAAIGMQVVENSSWRGLFTNLQGLSISISSPGFVDQAGWVDADYAAAFARWSDIQNATGLETWHEAYALSEPVAGGVLDGVLPFGELDATPVLGRSGFTPSELLRETPTITGLVITDVNTGSFEFASNLSNHNPGAFWSINLVALSDAEDIVRGHDRTTAAVDYGFAYSWGSLVPANLTTALPAGTYFLNVAHFNSSRKVAVQSLQFTVL